MPINVVNIGSNTSVIGGTVTITVGASGVPASAQIFVVTSDNGIGTGGMADTAGNSYANTHTSNTGIGLTLWRERSGGALVNGNTIVYTVVGTLAAVNAFYVTGLVNAAADVSNTATGSSATPSVTSPSPTSRGEFFVGVVGGATLVTSFTQDSTNAAWTTPPGSISNAAPVLGGGNVINSGSGALTYAPTFGTSDVWAGIIAAYLVQPDVFPVFDVVPQSLSKKITAGAAIAAIASGLTFVATPTLYPSYFGSNWVGPTYNKQIQYQALAFIKAAPFAETVSEDRWHQAWSIPQVLRKPGLPTAEQQFTAFGRAAPFPETVSIDRWLEPLSEPVRRLYRLGSSDNSFVSVVLVTNVPVPGVAEPAPIFIKQVQYQNTSIPVFVPAAASTPSFGWYSDLSRIPAIKASLGYQDFETGFGTTEVIYEDKWHFPWPDFAVRKTLGPHLQQTIAFVEASPFTEIVTESRWHQSWSEPVRIKRGLPAGEHQFLALVMVAPFSESVTEDRWHQPWSVPRTLSKPGLTTSAQQTLALVQAGPFGEVVFEDRWHQPWSIPKVLSKIGLPTAEQQTLALVKAAPFGEVIFEDKWHQVWSIPVKMFKPGLITAAQVAEVHSQAVIVIPGPTGTMSVTESGDVFLGQLIVYNPVKRCFVSIHEGNPRELGFNSIAVSS